MARLAPALVNALSEIKSFAEQAMEDLEMSSASFSFLCRVKAFEKSIAFEKPLADSSTWPHLFSEFLDCQRVFGS